MFCCAACAWRSSTQRLSPNYGNEKPSADWAFDIDCEYQRFSKLQQAGLLYSAQGDASSQSVCFGATPYFSIVTMLAINPSAPTYALMAPDGAV
jgi:hypothetical protein